MNNSSDWAIPFVVVAIIVGLIVFSYGAVSEKYMKTADEACEDRGAEFVVESVGWGQEKFYCQFPNGTTEPVMVDKLSGGVA